MVMDTDMEKKKRPGGKNLKYRNQDHSFNGT